MKFGTRYDRVWVRMLKESSVTGDPTGAPFSVQLGISSSNARGSNTFPFASRGAQSIA